MVGWLVDIYRRLVSWLVGLLADWLIGWLVGWLIFIAVSNANVIPADMREITIQFRLTVITHTSFSFKRRLGKMKLSALEWMGRVFCQCHFFCFEG